MARMLGAADLDLLEAILEPIPECPFFVKNAELRYVAANSSMARLCGARRTADLMGRTASDFFPLPFARHYEELDREVLGSGVAIRDRLQVVSSLAGVAMGLLFTRTPVRDMDGAVAGVVGTARRLEESPKLARLVAAADRIRTGFDQPLAVEDLARRAGISCSQLERDFKRVLGMTMIDFQHKVRLWHALRLLGEPGSIASVASECGYSDQSAFSRRFRALMHMTPNAYRRLNRQAGP